MEKGIRRVAEAGDVVKDNRKIVDITYMDVPADTSRKETKVEHDSCKYKAIKAE